MKMENNNNNISKSHTASTCVVKVSFFCRSFTRASKHMLFKNPKKKSSLSAVLTEFKYARSYCVVGCANTIYL